VPFALTVLAVAVFLTVGCSTTNSEGSAVGTTAATPSTVRGENYGVVADPIVTAGLGDARSRLAAIEVTLASSQAEAKVLVQELYDQWSAFAGTMRNNDEALFLRVEDALAEVKAGVEQKQPDRVGTGIAAFEAEAATYLALHP
jgi:hypothetical protein